MFKTFVFVLTLAAAPMVFANAPVAVDANDFSGQRAQIEKDLADGETYVEISSADRGRVQASLERISAMLEGGKTPEALSADQKVDLYNNQEIINTILTQASADSRKVCTREAVTGSNRQVTTCTTVAERTRRREKDQEEFAKSRRGLVPLRN